ncbi:YbaB/EbfC family nucleoid-associated protein [Actinacidiphila alni]|uniref:YbaB/EbfC DNA-binding family protein n=1 Tax=Actinacidiphila alni TaxID=380248 RepID=A0A1I2E8F4_9ACTN|nr:YbaB/EbfC family nucleoid-associated protein [Actinacidiphila alni]SFE89222.1 YbaB/EbfC DNA-binding family protein [Actinacidiphila alni]
MSTPYDRSIEELLALYRRQREEAVETRRRINEVTGTATAPRQAVKVTVGAQGEVTALEFPTGAYRRMAPKELADLLVSTIAEARADALDKVSDAVSPGLPEGVTVGGLLRGEADPLAFLPEDPAMPDQVRDYLDNGRPEGAPHL